MVKKTCASNSTIQKFKALQVNTNRGIQKNKAPCQIRPRLRKSKQSNQLARMMGGCSLKPRNIPAINSSTLVGKIINTMRKNAKKQNALAESRRRNLNEKRQRAILRARRLQEKENNRRLQETMQKLER